MANRENLEKLYFRVIEWGTYAALFTPLVFIKDYFFPFVVPKTIFFRIAVDVIFLAYILLAMSNPKYRPKLNALTIAVTVFMGILVLTSITGVNFERSFWSIFERMTGLLTFFHLFAFYIVLTSVFRERKYWERILSASILVGALICLYSWTADQAITRGGATLGNSSFLSAYLLFNIFFSVVLLTLKSGFWRILYGSALIMFLIVLLGGPTKGAVSAFWGGLFVFGFSYLMFYLFSSRRKLFKNITIGFIVLAILGGAGILQLGFVQERAIEIWNSSSVQSRLVVWNMGWQGWQEKLWLGWGPENFNIPFAKYYNPELPLTQDIWYDRVHNVVLDTGVTSGILGLVGYLAIFGVAIWQLIRVSTKVSEMKNLILPLGMISLLLIYFAQNFWVFDMISSYVVFFLALAFISFLISPQKEEEYNAQPKSFYSIIGAVLIIITVFIFYFGNIQVARASKDTVRGLYYPLEQSIEYFQKALNSSPISQFEAPEQLSTRIIALAQEQNQNQQLLQQGLQMAEEEMKKTIEKNPLDFRNYLFLGKYYNSLYQVTQNKENLVLAEGILKKAEEFSPKNQQVFWFLAQTKLFDGKTEEAIDFLQKAVDLEPRLSQSHWYLAMAYSTAGKYDLALEEAMKSKDLGYDWENRAEGIKQVIEIYRGLGNTDALLPLYERGVQIAPEDANLWANLADIYAAYGEKEKAKEAAEKVLKLKPELKSQIEEFLKDLGY